MPPRIKPNAESKPPHVSRRTRSHTRADLAESASTRVHPIAEGSVTKTKSKGKSGEVGVKRNIDDTKLDDHAMSEISVLPYKGPCLGWA